MSWCLNFFCAVGALCMFSYVFCLQVIEPTLPIRARDFSHCVAEQTEERILLDPEELFSSMYNVVGLKTETAHMLVMGQVDSAKRREARRWLEHAAYFGTIMFTKKWVADNIGKKKVKPTRKFNPSNSNTRPIRPLSPMEEDSDQSPNRSRKKTTSSQATVEVTHERQL